MFNKKMLSIIFIFSLIINPLTYGNEVDKHKENSNNKANAANINNTSASNAEDTNDPEKIINEYKHYVSSITGDVRDEVISFRKSVATLNKQKRELYNKLSQKAQDYLAREQEYRRKLPVTHKKRVNLNNAE